MADGIGGGVARRKKAERRRKQRRRWIIVLIVLGVITVGAGGVGVVGLVAAANYVDGLPDLAEFEQRQFGENSQVFDRNGVRITVLPNAQNRRAIPIARMSPWILKATVAIEDKRFYEHEGVDPKAIFRAAVRDVQAGEIKEGGSTLTQQLVSQLFIEKELSFDRKVREAWLALQLEDEWSKDKILSTYLNTVFYGHNAYGIEAASQAYFNIPARRLGPAQAALLAGLVQQPSRFDPFNNPEAAVARRNDVLRAMRDTGYIPEDDYAELIRQPLRLKAGRQYRNDREPFIVQLVRSELNEDPAFGPEAVRNGGLRIRTTVEPKLQVWAEEAMHAILKTPGDPDAAVVSINPKTGDILAMTSTRPYSRDQFDLATQGSRQPGSTFKPIALATAIEFGIDPFTTRYVSAPFHYQENEFSEPWDVQTAGGSYAGSVTLAHGTILSDNTVYAQLAIDLGAENIVDMARRLGVKKATLDPFPSIALGGLTNGVSPLEVTSVYATFASGGVYRRPHVVSEVKSSKGKVLKKFRPKGQRAISDGVAYEVTKILGDNMYQGTGTNARSSDNRPQAGKTGTTDNYTDAWFCGYTPDIATCVWVGYPNERREMYNIEGYSSVSGPTLPSDIWHLYMDRVFTELLKTPTEFPLPTTPLELEKYFSEFTGKAEIVTAPTVPQETVEAEISTEAPGDDEAPVDPGETEAPPPPPPPPSTETPPPATEAPPPVTDQAQPPPGT